jgi:hypothetical protein
MSANLSRPGASGSAATRPSAALDASASRAAALACLVLAVSAGLLLRLHDLGQTRFWVDEAATFGIAALSWADFRAHVLWVEANPPGYYMLMKLWRAVTPLDEAWLRLPSVLVGTAALLPFFLFCRRAFGPHAAIAAVLLLAISASHVRFSQEARTYALLFLLYACALLAAQALALRPIGWPRHWAGAAALAVLSAGMMYLHATGLIAAASVFVYAFTVLLARGDLAVRRLLPLLAAGTGALLLAAPWIEVALGLLTDDDTVMSWQPPLTFAHGWTMVEQVLLAPYLSRLALPAGLLHAGLFGWAAWRLRGNAEALGCLVALGFALLSTVLISLAMPIMYERTILFTLALWLAVLAGGLGTIRRPLVMALVLLPVVLLQARALQNHYRVGHYAMPWDTVARHVRLAAGPDGAVLAIGVFDAVVLHHYMEAGGASPAFGVMPLGYEAPFTGMASAMLPDAAVWHEPTAGDLCRAFGDAGRIWIVERNRKRDPRRDNMEAALRANGSERVDVEIFEDLVAEQWSPQRCSAPPGG